MGRISAAVQAGRSPSLGATQDRAEQQIQQQTGSPTAGILPTEQLQERTPQATPEVSVSAPQATPQATAPQAAGQAPQATSQRPVGTLEAAMGRAQAQAGQAQPLLDRQPTSQGQAQAQALENERRGRPTWERVQETLSDARDRAGQAGVGFETKVEDFNIDALSDDLFAQDLSVSDDIPIIPSLDDVESPFKFDVAANKATKIIEQEVKRPEFAEVASKLGILRQDGTVDPEAGAQVMFSVAAQQARRGITVNEELDAIEREFEESKKRGDADKLDSKKRNAAQRRDERIIAAESRPDFDAFQAPKQTMQMIEELRTPPSVDEFGGTSRPRPAFNITPAEQQEFMSTMLSRMSESDVGLLEPVDYVDPNTGKSYLGFRTTEEMTHTTAGIKDQLRLINLSFEKDVSYTPNYKGLNESQSRLLHNQRGRTTGDFDLHEVTDARGRHQVSDSLTYLGTNANKVLPGALAAQIGVFEEVYNALADNQPGSLYSAMGISRSPMASAFLKDEATFMSKIPNGPWQSFAELEAEWNQAVQSNNEQAIQQMLENFLYPAKNLFDSAAGTYAKPVYDSMRHNGRNIYYEQTLQGQSGRQMDASTVLNMQTNKKARGMVGSSTPHFVKGRTPGDIASGKNKPTDRKSRNFEAMIARLFGHKRAEGATGVQALQTQFEELITNTPIAEAAIYIQQTSPDVTKMGDYMAAVNAHVENAKIDGVSAKELRPDSRKGGQDFPKTGRAVPKDSDPYIKRVMVSNVAGIPQYQDVNTGKTHGQMRQLVAQQLGLVDSSGKPKGKQDEADLQLNGLVNLGKYLMGHPFHADLTVEVDGKNSSFAITSIQRGDRELAEYSGVLWNPDRVIRWDPETGAAYYENYDILSDDFEAQGRLDPANPDASVVPLGDIRDFVQRAITPANGDGRTSVLDDLFPDPEQKTMWRKVYGSIVKHGLIKEAHKKPAMTTGYGKDAKSHGSSMKQLLENNPGLRADVFKILNKDPNADMGEVSQVMAMIEAAALKSSLGVNINQTGVLKLVGNAGAVLGVDVVMTSPSGYPMHMAASKTRLSEPVKRRQTTTGGAYDVAVFEQVADPSQRVEGDYEQRQEEAAGGKKTAYKMENRIGVNSIHGVDASVVHSTASQVLDVNKNRQVPLWFRQVYDAFIVDIDSFDTVVDMANNNFISNNRDWNIFTEAKGALNRVNQELMAIAKDKKAKGDTFDVTPDGEYGDFYQVLKNLHYLANSAHKRGFTQYKLTREQIKIINDNLRKIGFDKERGKSMSPDEFIFAFRNIYLAATGTIPTLNEYEKMSAHNKAGLIQEIVNQTATYFGSGASPYASVKQYS